MGVHWEGSLDAWQTNATGTTKKAYGVMNAFFPRSASDLWTCLASYLPTKNHGTLEAELPSLANEILLRSPQNLWNLNGRMHKLSFIWAKSCMTAVLVLLSNATKNRFRSDTWAPAPFGLCQGTIRHTNIVRPKGRPYIWKRGWILYEEVVRVNCRRNSY